MSSDQHGHYPEGTNGLMKIILKPELWKDLQISPRNSSLTTYMIQVFKVKHFKKLNVLKEKK